MSHIKKTSQSLFTVCAVLMMISNANAQNEPTVYVLKLNENNISSLKSSGKPLSSTVPEANRGKINAIVIGTVENQGQDAVKLDGKVEMSGDTAVIKLDDSLLDEMRKQPLRMDVNDNSFAQVYISYQPAAQPALQTPSEPPASTQTVQKPEEDSDVPQIEPATQKIFFVNLNSNETMRGEFDGFEQFKIKCSFGEITMPLDQISGIRFHTDSNDSAVVIMKNGDSLTGVPTVDAVKIKTAWGHADVAPEHMKSITTSSNAAFAQEQTDFGTRWQLRTAIPVNSNQNFNRPFGR